MTRLLSAGARGAERLAQATGVDHALDEAVEEAIVRALRSPAVLRAIERAIENQEIAADATNEQIAHLVKRVLDSDAAGQAWKEVLSSDQVQMLVERIAGAPEIRAAIASQGAGLLTDIGVRLTVLTERFDDGLERIVRPRAADSETDQAGLATRVVAGAIDVGLIFAAYSLISGVVASVVADIFGPHPGLVAVIILSVLGVYAAGTVFATFWALAGQTPGMRFLSIRLLHHGSRDITLGVAAARVFGVILSLIPLGLGFFAILRDPSRRAWHDRMTGTEVVYDIVARTAPHAGDAGASAAAARHRARPREARSDAAATRDTSNNRPTPPETDRAT
jgi:uncharacterized RDD family membrane protein YckC